MPEVEQVSMRRVMASGTIWVFGARVAIQIFQLALMFCLARLLLPAEFGKVGMVQAFVNFVAMFTDLGLGAVLVQQRDAGDRHFSTVFWLNLALGASLFTLAWFAAPWVAAFYSEPALLWMVRAAASGLVVSAFSAVQLALLNRNLMFRLSTRISVVATVSSGTLALLLAWYGAGAWSLLLQALLNSSIIAVLAWHAAAWRPNWVFDRQALHQLFLTSRNLVGFGFVNYFVRNMDSILIGRMLGSVPLGHYSRALALMNTPMSFASGPISGVLFPVLSAMQHDRARVAQAYLRVLGVLALVTFPMMTGLLATADLTVQTLLGPGWHPVTAPLQWLCLAGLMQSLGTTVGWLYVSQGRADLLFKTGTLFAFPLIGSIALGTWLGSISAVAQCYCAASLASEIVSLWIAARLVGLKLRNIASALGGIGCLSGLMGVAVGLARTQLPLEWPAGLRLTLLVLLGIGLYLGALEISRLPIYGEARQLGREKLQSLWEKAANRTPA